MNKVFEIYLRLTQWAKEYQPAVATTLAAAFFQMLLGLGIAVGDWPSKVDAVLAFVAVATTLLAGRKIQQSVYSPATHREEVRKARSTG